MGREGAFRLPEGAGLNPGDGSPVANLAVTESEVSAGTMPVFPSAPVARLRPVQANGLYHIAWPMLFLRDDATTDRWLKEAEQRFPSFPRLQYLRAGFDYLRGNEAEAFSRMRKSASRTRPMRNLTFLPGSPTSPEHPMRKSVPAIFRSAPGLATTQSSNRNRTRQLTRTC